VVQPGAELIESAFLAPWVLAQANSGPSRDPGRGPGRVVGSGSLPVLLSLGSSYFQVSSLCPW